MPKDLFKELTSLYDGLETLIKQLDRALKNAPPGRIQTSVSRSTFQYYLVNEGKKHYLPKCDREPAKQILQRDYDRKLLEKCKKIKGSLQRLLPCCSMETLLEIYESLPESKRVLLDPRITTRGQFVAEWELKATALYANFQNSHPLPDQFMTDRGENVRSKSELIIANLLNRHKIPYFYELPLQFKSGVVLYPDFTILNSVSRKVFYWEHFGMTDDFNYTSKMASKLYLYEHNGITPGENLIMTFESKDCPLDIGIVRKKIKEYLVD